MRRHLDSLRTRSHFGMAVAVALGSHIALLTWLAAREPRLRASTLAPAGAQPAPPAHHAPAEAPSAILTVALVAAPARPRVDVPPAVPEVRARPTAPRHRRERATPSAAAPQSADADQAAAISAPASAAVPAVVTRATSAPAASGTPELFPAQVLAIHAPSDAAALPRSPAPRPDSTREAGGFALHVGRDGRASTIDAPHASVSLALPTPRSIGRGLAAWINDPYAEQRAHATRRPRSSADAPKPQSGGTVPIIKGGFDLTDSLARLSGRDPYYAKKLHMLDATREARIEMNHAYREAQARRVTEATQALAQTCLQREIALLAQHEAIFELWDDAGEQSLEGELARLTLERFICARWPATTPTAYTPDELARLNTRRRSRRAFSPYDGPCAP